MVSICSGSSHPARHNVLVSRSRWTFVVIALGPRHQTARGIKNLRKLNTSSPSRAMNNLVTEEMEILGSPSARFFWQSLLETTN